MKYRHLLVCLLTFTSCAPAAIRKNDAFADGYLKAHPDASASLVRDGVLLHYISRGERTHPKVIFIHGSPGSWKSFAAYLDDPGLASRAYLVLPDRPGYGESNEGRPMPSLTDQVRILSALLDLGDPKQPAILVGHSYGGAVVARMAMLGDSRIKAIVIAAGSIDPALESKKWFQYPADWFFIRWMLSGALDSCNQEIEALKGELIAMLPLWNQINCRVDVVQGLADTLVPPENADFIEKQLKGQRVNFTRIPNQGHFLPWEQHDFLVTRITTALESLVPQLK